MTYHVCTGCLSWRGSEWPAYSFSFPDGITGSDLNECIRQMMDKGWDLFYASFPSALSPDPEPMSDRPPLVGVATLIFRKA